MLLQRLVEYARERLNLPPPGYQRQPVRWIVDLDRSGRLLALSPTVGGKGRERRGLEMMVPHIQRTYGIRAILLVDQADYALAVGEGRHVANRHRAFVDLVRECAQATKEPDVVSVQRFLESLHDRPPKEAPPSMGSKDLVAFTVEGRKPWDLPAVRSFWADYIARTFHSQEPSQCLVCGQERPITRRLTVKIKGIPGGPPGGVVFFSANKPAFESYGLKETFVSPVCDECGEASVNALNSLLADSSSSLRVGRLVYAFWTREPARQGIFRSLTDPDPQEVRRLLESARAGRPRAPLTADRYYALSLSASGGRAVVRDWLEDTVEEAQENLARYFQMQALPSSGPEPDYFPVNTLVRSLVPARAENPEEEVHPNAVKALLHTALSGAPVPHWLLHLALERTRKELGKELGNRTRADPKELEKMERRARARISLIKLAILSEYPRDLQKEGTLTTEDVKHPAYLCGRLLRLLERAQEEAVSPEATLIERFYGSASSAPASVFGVLLRNAQAHLAKLRSDRPGLYTHLQREIAEILSHLQEWPRSLTLREQALFALGYYQQRAQDFAPKAPEGPGGASPGGEAKPQT